MGYFLTCYPAYPACVPNPFVFMVLWGKFLKTVLFEIFSLNIRNSQAESKWLSLFTSGFNFVPCRPWYHLLNWGFDVLEIVEKFCDFSWLYSFSFFDILITIFNRGLIYSSSVVIHDWVWLGPWRPIYCFWLSFSNFVIQTL